ncbi:MAG: hypothetical protein JRI68_19135 [Deltaproteobacteria bacterium]|nr:hypothetical protein [Deltaproteobacteria bacterium]
MSKNTHQRVVLPALASVFLALGACGAPSGSASTPVHQPYPPAPPPTAAGTPAPLANRPPATTGSACAGDAGWITDLGQPIPLQSTLMRFDVMRARGDFGPAGPVVTFNEFGGVTRSSEEKYEWKPLRNPQASNRQLVVLRNAAGPIPKTYDAPQPLPNGVVVYPERQRSGVWGHDDPSTLFVFPDGTWVRSDGNIAEGLRTTLADRGTPPPLPSADPDVAWEICGKLDPNELVLPWDIWTIRGNRVAVRLFGSRPEGELVYPFDSPALAARAAADQSASCGKGRCPWVTGSQVEGPLVRYGIVVRKTPTSGRNVLEIARTTPMLATPPSANAPVVPGLPPSGVYQQFFDIRADTCPTQSAGQKFPSMFDVVSLTHKGGRVFTTLESVEPRAPGIMTSSPMPDVELKVGAVVRREARHLCPNFTIAREMTVLAVTGNTIQVRDIVHHQGSTVGCRHANLPSNCHHEAVTTWVLARKGCDARCSASYDGYWSYTSGDAAPGIDMTCVCP